MLRRLGTRLHQASGPLALCLVLTGGVAYAANTIGSADIIDDSVRSIDLKDSNVRGADVRDGTLGSRHVADDSLRGRDVANDSLDGYDIQGLSFADLQPNTLTGNQINEGTLAQAGTGRSDLDACNPNSPTYLSCAQAVVTLEHPGRLLVIGSAYYLPDDSDDGAYQGVCRLRDSQGTIYMTRYRFRDDSGDIGTVPFTVVTGVLPAGIHSVRIECMEPSSNYGITFPETSVAVVGLSSR